MTKIGEKESRKRKKKKKKKTTGGDIVLILIFIVALVVAVFAGYKLYSIFAEYKAGVDEYSQIADTVVKERDADVEKIKKLKEKKFRDLENSYIVEGIKLVKEAIDENQNIKYVVICEDCINNDMIDQKVLYEIA